jgi:hypothetical protein
LDKGGNVNWRKLLPQALIVMALLGMIVNFLYCKSLNKAINITYTEVQKVVPSSLGLDFSNKSGAGRVRSSFTDVLISPQGAVKKGEGYEVKLQLINPSSIVLSNSNIIFNWDHDSRSMATTISNPNATLYPGSTIFEKAFLSPLEGDELKRIWVEVDFDFMRVTR